LNIENVLIGELWYPALTDSVPVADERCGMEPPEHTRFCETLCPHDCVVSQWSQWSDCLPDLCQLQSVKSKEGEVL